MMNNEFHTVRGYRLLEQNKNQLTSAMEDYLEMIYRNSMEEGYIRISKLADLLNVRAPSASKMVQRLSELDLLKFEKYGIVLLNENGKELGKFLLERHRLLEDFLKLLGCEDDLLQQTELIEHTVTPKLLEDIEILSNFFLDNKEIKDKYIEYKIKNSNIEKR